MLLSQQGFYFYFSFKRDFFVFGKNNETSYVHFLWRREKNEKRPPPPPSRPLSWADVTQEIAEPVDFLPCRKAGTRLELLIGWRMEKELDLIYYHAKTPRGMGCETP